MKLSRESWLALGLITLLLIVTTAAGLWQARQATDFPPLATFSSARDGGRALLLWLQEMGHTTLTETPGQFEPPPNADLALVLEPGVPGILEEEWETLSEWVAGGGTLVLAGEGIGALLSSRHFGFEVAYQGNSFPDLVQVAPLLTSPPLPAPLALRSSAILVTDRDDVVTVLSAPDGPVLVTFRHERGRVFLTTLSHPFSNEGLKASDGPQLVLNLLAAAAGSEAGDSGLTIWFDEWHHGVRDPESDDEFVGPARWVRETPAGRAILYAAAVLFVALVLSGRRFGRPVPLPESSSRRSPVEHIKGVATLNRRAGNRQEMLAHYRGELKRGLGRRYGLNPTLPDDEYVTQLASYDPSLDAAALRQILSRLRQATVSEGEMVTLAQAVDDWLKRAP